MAGQVLQLAANFPRVLWKPVLEAPIDLAGRVATAATGRLVEISGQGDAARLTLAVDIVRQVQAECETAAWVQLAGGPLFPPDLHDARVDLDSLVVIHVPASAGPYGVPRAAELLLRSGGFGLVVLDLTEPVLPGDDLRRSLPSVEMTPAGRCPPGVSSWRRGTGWQGRLLGLAREHQSRVVCITGTPQSGESLGPLVALRVQPVRVRVGGGLFAIKPRVLRNKPGVDLERAVQSRRGPWGLE
jgi:recombination protein RecA